MLGTRLFGQELKKHGFDFYSGVPDSSLKYLINYAINDCDYIAAANEGDAVAICAGAYLGGRKSVVIMQNSGLTNATSPLASLNYIFKIPVLGFVGLRGEEGSEDEPQHELMGKITTDILDLLKIEWEYLAYSIDDARSQIKRANDYIEKDRSFFFVVRKGTFDKEDLGKQDIKIFSNKRIVSRTKDDELPKRIEVLKILNALKGADTILLATTGYTGRELYEVEDASNNLYMVGSMGCIGSLGLGLAIARRDKDIIAIDGDGALLMRMGSLATNASHPPSNMLHILLDNNAHESTGGQLTVSNNVDFVKVAASCSYEHSLYAHNLEELDKHVKEWKHHKGLTFIHIKIAQGTKDDLARPKIKPYEVKERLMRFLNN